MSILNISLHLNNLLPELGEKEPEFRVTHYDPLGKSSRNLPYYVIDLDNHLHVYLSREQLVRLSEEITRGLA